MLPVIALIGRPNTGKSTLFNRIIGKKHAIIANEAGTTRDRVYMHTNIGKNRVILVDTGGLSFNDEIDFETEIKAQTKLAIAEADLILFVTDSSQPLTASDQEAAILLRKTNKPVIIVANKSDHSAAQSHINELYALGFSEPIAISAIHNTGIADLETNILKHLPKMTKAEPENPNKIKIGFIGKPNVGKSSLVNKLLGREQVMVSDVSGTTRDSTYIDFTYNDQEYTFVDTAGIRRRGKRTGIEKFSVMRTIRPIESIDIALLIIDGTEGLVKQDMHVSEYILEAHKGLIIIVNKADQIKPEEKNRLLRYLQAKMQYAYWAPVIFTSAKTGSNITKILEVAKEAFEQQQQHINTSELNLYIKKATLKQPPQSHAIQKPKILFVTQAASKPPTFVFFCKNAENMHFSYKRYLENQIRERYSFTGSSIKLIFRDNVRTDKVSLT